ncbi:hypothetical protein, partial [Mesorhizobium sp.]|uniref:hypothetical protein n=1 Tax=Mesorhizobium sp. TaxID=1871066 RepID=UPI0025D3CD36
DRSRLGGTGCKLLVHPARPEHQLGAWAWPQKILPPRMYLGLYMVLLSLVAYLPVHLVLKRLFRP